MLEPRDEQRLEIDDVDSTLIKRIDFFDPFEAREAVGLGPALSQEGAAEARKNAGEVGKLFEAELSGL